MTWTTTRADTVGPLRAPRRLLAMAEPIAQRPRMPDDTVECVSLEGRADVVTDDARREQWTQRYVDKYRPIEPSLTAEFVLSNLIVQFTPSVGYGVIERADEFATRPTRWRFGA